MSKSKQRAVRRVRQALDAANPVSHDPRINAMGIGITVGQLVKMIEKLEIPNDAKIKFAVKAPGWILLESVSFCREQNEVSLW